MDVPDAIRLQFDIVRNNFLREGGHRYACALYAIGGFARGEGTYTLQGGRLQVCNDMDFLAVLPRKTPRRLLGMLGIQRHVNDGRIPWQIDFVVESRAALQHPAPTIQNFDIQQRHIRLWGEQVLESAGTRALAADAVSRADALQLLFNRQASLLIAFRLLRESGGNPSYLQVQLSKPLLAMMAALLIAERRYVVPVREQLAAVEQGRQGKGGDPLWAFLEQDELLALLRAAVEFKHAPSPSHFAPFERSIEAIAAAYHPFMLAYMRRHYGLPPDTPFEALARCFRERQPLRLDLLSPGWWACRLRCGRGGCACRAPGRGPHPQVDVYLAHLDWLRRHVAPGAEADAPAPDADELDGLINRWKVSGHGCRLR